MRISLDFVYSSGLIATMYDRAMAELRVLRLFGNPLEFLPEILPLHKLRHLSLANIRIVADENLRSVNVQIEVAFCRPTRHFLALKQIKYSIKHVFPGHCRWKTILILVHLGISSVLPSLLYSVLLLVTTLY